MYYDHMKFISMVGSLPEDAKKQVALAASRMLTRRIGKARVKTDEVEGLIKTDFREVTIGVFAGPEFQAELDTFENGKVRFSFLLTRPITEEELDDLRWIALLNAMDMSEPRRETGRERQPVFH